jgi:hypothetical protein
MSVPCVSTAGCDVLRHFGTLARRASGVQEFINVKHEDLPEEKS